jgi:hypothetical protein
MFNFENYFRNSGSSLGLGLEFIYFLYLTFLTLINIIIFLRTRKKLQENQYPQSSIKYFFLSMFGLVIWNSGEITLSISLFVFDNQKSLLVGTDNFFLVLGVIMATTFFSMYIQTILKTKRYHAKRKLINSKIVNVISIIAFFCFIVVFGRFIALGFFEEGFRESSLRITLLFLLISVAVIIFLLLFVTRQLYVEKGSVTSKINKVRINFFISYYIILTIGLFGMLLFLIFSIIAINEFILYLIPYVIFLTPTLAIVVLYYGLFLPIWLQKRVGIIKEVD